MTKFFQHLRACFRIDSDNSELAVAQVRAFTKQVPLLYLVLLANTGFVALTHYHLAPFWLTVVIPTLFACIAISRLVGWWSLRAAPVSPEMAVKRLHDTVRLCGVLSIALSLWSHAIYPFGGAEEHTQVLFFMAFTMVACVFCLMHLRAAAFVLATLVTVGFVGRFAMTGSWVMTVIAVNLLLVTAAMLFILSNHFEDFSTMVMQKSDLEKTNREALRLNAENTQLANCDSLTALPNRRSFFAEIERRSGLNDDQGFGVGLLDLDGFKAVNDLYGHATGDELLVEASQRMQATFHSNVFFARLGGDEFGFIINAKDDVEVFALSICEVLRQPYHLADVSVEVSASCGVALYPQSGKTASHLMEHADYALYHAKEHANGLAVIFGAEHHDQIRRTHQIDQCLRSANLYDEMTLNYQPIYEYRTGNLVCFEALARWNSALLGKVLPTDFIAVAERSPLINKLTLVLLSKMLQDMQLWPEHIGVSFNLSSRNLASPETMLKIVALLSATGINPKRIEFEVTETAVMIDFDNAVRALTMLRNLGASIALDDFGTGYSSLSHVHQLPLNKIKIDRRFVADMTTCPKARSIVTTIVDLSKNLGLDCVAEGIETAEQADMISDCGCNLMQGYLFGRPAPASDIVAPTEFKRSGRKTA